MVQGKMRGEGSEVRRGMRGEGEGKEERRRGEGEERRGSGEKREGGRWREGERGKARKRREIGGRGAQAILQHTGGCVTLEHCHYVTRCCMLSPCAAPCA